MCGFDIYIFDLDDTLINTMEMANQYYYPRLAKHLNKSIPSKSTVKKYWSNSIETSLEQIFNTKIDNHQDVIKFLRNLHVEKPVQPIHNALRILSILKKHKKWVCIYSSSHPQIMMTDLKLGLNDDSIQYDYVYSTTEQETVKPSKEIVDRILEQYRIQKGTPADRSKVLLVGDSVNDFLTAKNAGVRFAAVLTGVASKNDFIEQGLKEKDIYLSIREVFNMRGHGIVAVIRNKRGEILLVKEGRKNNKYYNHWSGPHGRCITDDIIEEETVVRETHEECNIKVIPVKKLYTRQADSKVETVSFWEVTIDNKKATNAIVTNNEVSEFQWANFKDIIDGKYALFPGTTEFFQRFKNIL